MWIQTFIFNSSESILLLPRISSSTRVLKIFPIYCYHAVNNLGSLPECAAKILTEYNLKRRNKSLLRHPSMTSKTNQLDIDQTGHST